MTTWPRIWLREAVYSNRKCLDANQADSSEALEALTLTALADAVYLECTSPVVFRCSYTSAV